MTRLSGTRRPLLVPVLLAAVALVLGPLAARGADPPSRTFNAPVDRVWTVAESVLQSLGWEIDKADRAVGWILTDSRGLDFKDYAVYGKGVRHKLRLTLKVAGEGRTTVAVEREVYSEERILWMTERKPVQAPDQAVEAAVLDAIGRAL
jgi:hypothetical protein